MQKTPKKELEKTLQARCIRYLRDNNIVFFKIIAASPAGIPDLCILSEKGTIFFEFKSKNGKLTDLQRAQIARLEGTTAARVFVVRNFDDFIEKLRILSIL